MKATAPMTKVASAKGKGAMVAAASFAVANIAAALGVVVFVAVRLHDLHPAAAQQQQGDPFCKPCGRGSGQGPQTANGESDSPQPSFGIGGIAV